MPLDATPESPHGADSSIQTLPEIAAAFIQEAKALATMESERTLIDVAIRKAWARQAERFWTVKHVHGASVDKFRKLVNVAHTTAFDLVRYHECRAAIEKKCENDQAAAIKAGQTYRWPGWAAALDAHLGRKARKDDVGKPDAKVLAQTLIVVPLQERIVELETELTEARRVPGQRKFYPHEKTKFTNFDNDEWETPPPFYSYWNNIFDFYADLCASEENHKNERYYNKSQNGLGQRLLKGKTYWANVPYSYPLPWARKFAMEATDKSGAIVVALFRLTTATEWSKKYVQPYAAMFLLQDRIQFVGAGTVAPWDNFVAIYPKSAARRMEKLCDRPDVLILKKPIPKL